MTPTRIAPLACALLLALPAAAFAESDDTPPLPDRNPERLAKPVRNPTRAEGPIPPGDAPTVPWTDDEIDGAREVADELDDAGLGVSVDSQSDTLSYRIREAELEKIGGSLRG